MATFPLRDFGSEMPRDRANSVPSRKACATTFAPETQNPAESDGCTFIHEAYGKAFLEGLKQQYHFNAESAVHSRALKLIAWRYVVRRRLELDEDHRKDCRAHYLRLTREIERFRKMLEAVQKRDLPIAVPVSILELPQWKISATAETVSKRPQRNVLPCSFWDFGRTSAQRRASRTSPCEPQGSEKE